MANKPPRQISSKQKQKLLTSFKILMEMR